MSALYSDSFGGQHARFFNQNVNSLRTELQNYVKSVGKRLKHKNKIEKYTYDLLESGSSEVYVYGRIYAGFQEDDPSERLSFKNAEIHFHPKFDTKYLKFDFANDATSGLFRGQIIAAYGTVDTQSFHASKIFTDCREFDPQPLPDGFSARILAVSGPYIDESFEPLDELNAKIKSYSPDITIFFGPFAQSTSKLLTSADCQFTALELTEKVIEHLSNGIGSSVFIPANSDALALPVIPRPALPVKSDANIMGDPTFISFNELEILATANDLQQMTSAQFELTPTANEQKKTRRTEIPKLIAHQMTAFPAMDPAVQIQYLQALVPKAAPHIILAATKVFPTFHENIDGTHIIYTKHVSNSPINFVVIDVKENDIITNFTSDFNK